MSEPTHHTHTVVPPRVYAAVFGTLLCFTALTVFASYLELGVFNAVVALAIAVIKSLLVILFFMHIRYSSKLTKLTLAAGFFTFIVLVGMTLTDYMSRAWGMW
ncbi:MAG: cytochrome C oxidase subunit IV family protein [Acidobacteriaceae bacterium]